jgi:hypothetical protein
VVPVEVVVVVHVLLDGVEVDVDVLELRGRWVSLSGPASVYPTKNAPA